MGWPTLGDPQSIVFDTSTLTPSDPAMYISCLIKVNHSRYSAVRLHDLIGLKDGMLVTGAPYKDFMKVCKNVRLNTIANDTSANVSSVVRQSFNRELLVEAQTVAYLIVVEMLADVPQSDGKTYKRGTMDIGSLITVKQDKGYYHIQWQSGQSGLKWYDDAGQAHDGYGP